jgi:hypothetical protein
MNRKLIPAVAAFLIVGMLLSAIPLSVAQVYAIGPQLGVVTIPQGDQELGTGVMILGTGTSGAGTTQLASNLLAEYKIVITYNGQTLEWQIGTAGPSVVCNVLEKDKVAVVPDPKTGLGSQGSWEVLMTTLVDVSNKFICKARWKQPFGTAGVYESVGVLDVYYDGPLPTAPVVSTTGVTITPGVTAQDVGYFIADNIVTVEAFFYAGTTVIFGSDIQDLCTLGWAVSGDAFTAPAAATASFSLPDGVTLHYIWSDPMGTFVSCESLALLQRQVLGIYVPTGPDPVAVAAGV